MESRDHLGQCLSSVDCTESCGPEGGTFLITAGICECARAAQETAICDGTCKANLPTTTLEEGAVKLFDPITQELSFLTHPEVDLTHAQKYCSMIRVDRSELQAKALDNSLICITVGSTVVWELQDGAFPVYLEDSLLNSSSTFDETNFRRLLNDKDEGKPNPGFFVHTFESEGTYVFASSLQQTKLGIVRVLLPGTKCPGETAYPTPIRSRSLSLLAISITAGDLLLHPNWSLLVGVLVALIVIVLLFLFILARFVWHRWRATRSTAEFWFSPETHQSLPLAYRFRALTMLLNVLPRFLRPSGAAQIVHYRIRDDLVDQTEQTPYDAVADVRPALDHLQVEIDVQDFRVATLEKLYDMRETLSKIGQTLNALQQRLDYADLKGPLPVASHHVTALLRCILSVLQGSGHSKEEAEKLYQLEKLQEQQGSDALATTWGGTGARQADILRIYVSKAGSSVYDSLDAISKSATERRETLTECQKALAQLPLEENEDPECGRHILLAAVHDLLAKRSAKIYSSSFKNLVSLYRHVDLAEHRISEKEAAFLNMCIVCQQEMIGLQDMQSLRVLKWQQDYIMSTFTRSSRILDEVSEPLNRAVQEEIRQQQEDQIKTKAEKHMELFRSSLQSYTDAATKHARALANREKASITKLSKALRKDVRSEYAAASAKATEATELRQKALESASRSSHDSLRKTMNATAILLTAYAKLKDSEEEESRALEVGDASSADHAKNSALEKLSEAFSRREKALLEFEAIRLELYENENEALMKTMTDFLRLTKERLKGMSAKTIDFAGTIVSAETSIDTPLLRHMAVSRALQDLLLVQALPGSTKEKIKSFKKHQEEAFQQVADTQLKRFQASHASTVVALKRLDDRYIDSLKKITYDHREDSEARRRTTMLKLHALERDQVQERLHIKTLVAKSTSKALLLREASAAYQIWLQNHLKLIQTSRGLHNDPEAMRARMAETNGKAQECAKMLQRAKKANDFSQKCLKIKIVWRSLVLQRSPFSIRFSLRRATATDIALYLIDSLYFSQQTQAQTESRLAEDLASHQLLSTKEDDLLLQIHEQQLKMGSKVEIEQISSELHEVEIHNATAFNVSLLLRLAERKAAAMAPLSQNQGPMANERNKFLHDLLHQLAIRQADAQYRSQKALLDAEQETTIGQVESELARIESLNRQLQGTLTHSEGSPPPRSQSLSSGARDRLTSGAEAHSPEQGEEGNTSASSESQFLAQSEANGEKGEGGEDGHTGAQRASQLAPQTRTNEGGDLDASADVGSASASKADRHARLAEAAGGALAEDHDNLLDELEEYLQHAEVEADRERLLQDHRTQQLLFERRERLLKKKAALKAQQEQKLGELEKLREANLEKLEHQLLQDIFDFSIEFEVEVPELEKLARQLWNESQHRHQEKLQELERNHTKKLELAYRDFLDEWAESHDGDVEAECHLRQASWSVISKRVENEQLQEKSELEDSWLSLLEVREQATQFRQQRFEALRRAQADVQRDLEKKEAAYKAHVEQRIKTVEEKWVQKLRETGSEEETKLWELQNLAEATFRERRRMIEEAAEAGRKGGELRDRVMAAKQTELLNELVADVHQLQQSLQIEKSRQKATYQRKLLEKVQRRKKSILKNAAEGRKSLVAAAMNQQQQVLGQLRQEQFLFGPAKTRQDSFSKEHETSRVSHSWFGAPTRHG
ncbi:hypothetical protein Emed_006358 [Eimeria media]